MVLLEDPKGTAEMVSVPSGPEQFRPSELAVPL